MGKMQPFQNPRRVFVNACRLYAHTGLYAQVPVVGGGKMIAEVPECLPYARHCAEDFTDFDSFKSSSQLWGKCDLHFAEEKENGG